MLQIFDVVDGDEIVAIEFTNGKDTWFYAYDQKRFPSLRIGKFPCDKTGKNFCRSSRENYQRIEHEIKPSTTKTPHYEQIGAQIGKMVTGKQSAYGDSFGKSGSALRILYPDGIKPDQYDDALAIVRIIDKLFRIANNKDAFGESPYKDIDG